MESRTRANKNGANFTISANFLEAESGKPLPKSTAYIFSANGRLLGQKPMSEKGVDLSVSASEGSKVHVVVGPEIKENITLAELRRRGGAEQALRVGSDLHKVDITVVPDKWLNWLLGFCFVQGHLFKRLHFGPFDFTLCVPNATIEIYEVDPFPRIIWQIPDDIIERLRKYILRPIQFPIPPIPPEEIIGPLGPMPDPEMEFNFNAQNFARGNAALPVEDVQLRSAAMPMMSAMSLRSASGFSDLQALASQTTTFQFRQTLTLHADLIRPLLCYFYPLVTMQLVATAVTNDDGYFSTYFYKGINNPDQPDLYFRAKQNTTLGPNTVIYAPTPIPCYTYWDYQCGTEVSLYTTHHAAIGKFCDTTVDGITVDRIGDFPLSQIRGTSLNLAASTNASNIGLTDGGNPWGGALRLRLEFDRDLPDTHVKYYRVQWRKGTSGSFTDLSATVDWTAVRNASDGTPIYSSYNIGPKIIGTTPNLYEIHSRGNLAPDNVSFWSPQNFGGVVANNTNAIFDTSTIAGDVLATDPDKAGIYQLKVDLFDPAGNQVTNLVAAGVKFFVPPSIAGDMTGDDASQPQLDLVHGGSFIMSVHVDNNRPVVDVQAPTLNGNTADNCGALRYPLHTPGTVTMPYIAGQRNGFATFTFKIRRGGTDIFNTPSAGVGVGSNTLLRTQTKTVADLLYPDCTVAGLLAEATVSPTAITGWGPVYSAILDNFAFAIAPETPHP